ncbi:MAG: capsule assembly Wzi family protein, partial [Rhodothermia bacterium]
PRAFLGHQPLSVYEAQRYLDTVAVHRADLSDLERRLLGRYRGDTTLVSAAKLHRKANALYRNGIDFVSSRGEDYSIQLNPLLYLTGGLGKRSMARAGDKTYFAYQNTRGLRLSGAVGPNVFFESRIEENQKVPGIPRFSKNTAPRLGNVKYNPGEDSLLSTAPYDYLIATGIVGVRTKYFEFRFGRDRNLWGAGKTSTELSNYSTVYDQLQIRTTVGRFQYTNLFAAFSDLTDLPETFAETVRIPRKYGAFHRLAVNISNTMDLSLFEGVVFSDDSTRSGFDIAMLNPVIFYRAVERDQGSSANVVIGTDFSWLVRPGFMTYLQVVIDEFKLSEVFRPKRGWWANKWSWMLGLQVADPIPGLNDVRMRIEYSRTRPFTFSHRIANQGYIHYEDLLAHPSGPNAEDVGLFFIYQPSQRFFGEVNLSMTIRGRNSATTNFGSDPGVSYETRESDFGNNLLQGIPTNYVAFEAHGGFELYPNLFLEGALQFEHFKDGVTGTDWYLAPLLTLRWGLPYQSIRY